MLGNILTWIFGIIAAAIGGFGLLAFGAGSSGKADPTAHGNIVAIQFGFIFMIVGTVIGLIVWGANAFFG